MPLTVATPNHFSEVQIGIIPTSETIFAGLKAKDIVGFCLVQLVITGVIISLVVSFAFT